MLRSDPSSGLGKPEPLKHNLSGLWSKWISQKDKRIYKFDDDYVYILKIGGNYADHEQISTHCEWAKIFGWNDKYSETNLTVSSPA